MAQSANAELVARVAALEASLQEEAAERKRLEKALAEALDQQTATSEILRVISSSPTDIQPVLDAVARSAARLCEAFDASVLRLDGDRLVLAAHHGPIHAGVSAFTLPLSRGTIGGRTVLEARTVHVTDVQAEAEEFPEASEKARQLGFHTMLSVPLMREAVAIGAIQLPRKEVRVFTARQVALLQTFAEQAVIAIENVRLFKELEARNRNLTEALEQQTATAEILRVISTSPTDLQRVLDTVVVSAARFCRAYDASMHQLEGGTLRVAAHHGPIPSRIGLLVPVVPGSVAGRAVLDRRPVHVTDIQAEAEEFPEGAATARERGVRTILSVPLLREGAAIGTIALRRAEVDPFTDKQIELLKTFADQAVIAIENARLFTETQEALERQTATSEILRVISGSPTDVQPVFDAVAKNAATLCQAQFCHVFGFDGSLLHITAHFGLSPEGLHALQSLYPAAPGHGSAAGRSMLSGQVEQVPDIRADAEYRHSQTAGIMNYRSIVAVPMLRDGVPVGCIVAGRSNTGSFPERLVRLLQTFADQAVIAIENVRLFKELAARNRELTESLERQMATSEILRVISRSRAELQPVFDIIIQSAVRLCGALSGGIFRLYGGVATWEAYAGATTPEWEALAADIRAGRRASPAPPRRESIPGFVMLEGKAVHVPDIEKDERFPTTREFARRGGYRSVLAVPMLRDSGTVGAILVNKTEPFPDGQIALLETFADQAMIAIENVRLFKELEARTQELTRSVGELRALGEVGQVVSSSLDLETVLTTIVSQAVRLSGLDGGTVFEYEEGAEEFVQRATTGTARVMAGRAIVRKGEGVVGQTAVTCEPVQVPDIQVGGAYESRLREVLLAAGVRAIIAVPIIREGRLLGGFAVNRNTPGAFPVETIELLRTFATQSALAIQNARLFHEIEDKSRQLEAASRHKSEFLANMSHELRTPLNAIIGFSEVLAERMFGELNAKQEEYLKDIYASGQHLLSLINDILDLSKIEAGRMELEAADFDLPAAIDNALTLVRERAARRGIALNQAVDPRLGAIRADERKIKQILLNLLSNAIKFTPEGGRIEVRAVPVDGAVEVAVADTGVGIAPEDQEAVFEEFRQVGTADRKVEGTGLGLALSRRFVELHGGRIWMESEVGKGSTFRFALPTK